MPAGTAVAVLAALRDRGVDVCVGGGWGVDALLGEQTRVHSDPDVWLPNAHIEPLFSALAERGIDRILPWPGDRPWNFVLHDGDRLRVDVHLYEVLPDGSFHYGAIADGETFPAHALSSRGTIAVTAVRCEAPEWRCAGTPATRHDRPTITMSSASASGTG